MLFINKIIPMVLNPLEQFEITPIFSLFFGFLVITDESIHLVLAVFYFFLLYKLIFVKGGYIIPGVWASAQEKIYLLIASLIRDNVKSADGQKYFPFIFTIFYFLLLVNCIGLVPYTFTATSHILVTFALALSIFIGLIIISIRKHGIKFFSAFLPAGTPLALAFLLVIIEIVSYIFKPISLSIRLFANIMAGHSLLKVIAGFSFALMNGLGILGFGCYLFPVLIMFIAYFLELAVAIIQSFVFTTLICIYLNDALNLH
jgi:ATP synthase subunit 6